MFSFGKLLAIAFLGLATTGAFLGYSLGAKMDKQDHLKWSQPYKMIVVSIGPKLSNGWQRRYAVKLVSTNGQTSVRTVSFENGLDVGYHDRVAFNHSGQMGYYDSIGYLPGSIALLGLFLFVAVPLLLWGLFCETFSSKRRRPCLA